MTAPITSAAASDQGRKPRDDELDFHGLTHPGLVRPENQDHFLIASLRRDIVVHATSLGDLDALGAPRDRGAFIAMVADGVGGGERGEEASRLAVAIATRYVAESVRCYYAAPDDDSRLLEMLQDAVRRCHEEVVRHAEEETGRRSMATTLTLWLGLWPRSYLVQVGDSRCYVLHRGELIQVSRDQTMAQDLVDVGVLKPEDAEKSRLAHTLSSSIGGRHTAPVVTPMLQAWENVGLLCSDGLTRHVSADRIRERLRTMTSARQVCENLLQDALDGGGSDNITILVGRAVRSGG
jgi:serine/threonine protein phosphatase PrpC